MTERTDVVALVHGATTEVLGRFRVAGLGYDFLADSALRGGGPGEEIGSLDLLVASLTVCALNVMRKDSPGDADEPSAVVECFARVTRGPDDGDRLGTLSLEFLMPEVTRQVAQRRATSFLQHCRVYRALRDSIDVEMFVNGRLVGLSSSTTPGRSSRLARLFDC